MAENPSTPAALFHTVRLTSAQTVTLPAAGMYLHRIRVYGGTTPGVFSWTYDGTAAAQFPAPSNGTTGYASYEVNERLNGNTIPAAVLAMTSGVSAVEFLFSDTAPSEGAPLSAYRGVFVRRTDSGATGANATLSYDVGPAKPRKVLCYISASAGRVTFPAVGAMQLQVEAVRSERNHLSTRCPEALPPATSTTLNVVTDGAATILAVVYY